MARDNEPCRYRECTVHPRRWPTFILTHFSREEVWAVCDMIAEGDTNVEIAAVFHVGIGTISLIRRGINYRQYVDEWKAYADPEERTTHAGAYRRGDRRADLAADLLSDGGDRRCGARAERFD